VPASLEQLNALSPAELSHKLSGWLGSGAWADAVAAARPFLDEAGFVALATSVWQSLGADVWRSALRDLSDPSVPPGAADARAAAEFALGLYRQRFGFTFVSEAPVPTAEELLMLIRIRLGHEEAAELRRGRDEYCRLTLRRFGSLLQRENQP
jgi:2-oxo-4-hydroxy-4-carboxy-5-ureidoimidazoline decarboxylase